MKNQLRKFKEDYGFFTGSLKWIPQGGDLLRYVGQEVIFVEYKKKEDDSWGSTYNAATIISMDSFDNKTNSYLIKYKIKDEEEERSERIIPEGYRFADGKAIGDDGYTNRFLPKSLHLSCIEESLFYESLSKRWDTTDTTDITNLRKILKESTAKRGETLKRRYYIAAVVKSIDDNTINYFRVEDLKIKDKTGKIVKIDISDGSGNTFTVVGGNSDKSYNLNIGSEKIGELKLILL